MNSRQRLSVACFNFELLEGSLHTIWVYKLEAFSFMCSLHTRNFLDDFLGQVIEVFSSRSSLKFPALFIHHPCTALVSYTLCSAPELFPNGSILYPPPPHIVAPAEQAPPPMSPSAMLAAPLRFRYLDPPPTLY